MLIVEDNLPDNVRDQMGEALLAVRPADVPTIDRHHKNFAVLERDGNGALQGGSYVYVHPGWAYVDTLWVDEPYRGQGLGRQIMHKTETEAVQRGCHSAYLWTQDFEAPEFYKKLGYQQFAVFEDFIPGHQRIGFMKRLAA